MNNFIKCFLILILNCIISSFSFGNEIFFITGTPQFSGKGCSSGSVSSTSTEDGGALSILFDDFSISASKGTSYNKLIKDCRIQIPIKVKQGYKLIGVQLDVRGFAFLENDNFAQISLSSPILSKWDIANNNFKFELKKTSSDFYTQLPFKLPTSNKCEQQDKLDFKINMQVKASNKYMITSDVVLSLESADLTNSASNLIFFAKAIPCL